MTLSLRTSFPRTDVDPISEYCPTGGSGGKDYKRENFSC